MAVKSSRQAAAYIISEDLNLDTGLVHTVLVLLDKDNTVPFIARYRKEQTGGLDPTVLRHVEALYIRQRAIRAKADATKKKIGDQLTPEIARSLDNAQSIEEVDQFFAPFKKGHKGTLAGRARQLGLDTAAQLVLDNPQEVNLKKWIDHSTQGLQNMKKVTLGVQHILADIISKHADTVAILKSMTERSSAVLESSLTRSAAKEKEESGGDKKYQQYHSFKMNITNFKSHQVLAINRAEQDKILAVKVSIPEYVKQRFISQAKQTWLPGRAQEYVKQLLSSSVEDAYYRLMEPMICRQSRSMLTKKAEKESVDIFMQNLYCLLLTPPVKGNNVFAIDPGYTHGCKVAMLSPTGYVLETAVIFPFGKNARVAEAKSKVTALITIHRCETIAIGNGVGCRELEAFISKLIQDKAFHPLDVLYCIVSEDGASIYSASKEAITELPGLDISMRGAVSIGRRLQDPLLELVKIEPKHLGIGMYQHDIPETLLRAALDGVLTDCVSFVGVDLNVAGVSSLKRLAGLNEKKARAIIDWREQNGRFVNREQLRQVKGIGDKTFEQCVGFMRVLAAADQKDCDTGMDVDDVIVLDSDYEEEKVVGTKRKLANKGKNASKCKKAKREPNLLPNTLDMTWIHPESYDVSQRFMDFVGVTPEHIGQSKMRTAIESKLKTESVEALSQQLDVGEPTLQLIIDGLRRPTDYDIRASFEKPLFKKGLTKFEDIHPGTKLTGRVTNFTTFGAFVDCGVGRDGLIHTSRMAGHDNVGAGDVVEVVVINVDKDKGHFGLQLQTLRSRLCPKLLVSTALNEN